MFCQIYHKKLLIKLKFLGIKSDLLKWFENNLIGSKQRIVIKEIYWSWTDVKSEMSYRSIFFPILFLIYGTSTICLLLKTASQ